MDHATVTRHFTTGEVARMLGVAPDTVSKWIDTKRLAGYRVPGSKHRRVDRKALIEFIQASGLPMPAELEPIEPAA